MEDKLLERLLIMQGQQIDELGKRLNLLEENEAKRKEKSEKLALKLAGMMNKNKTVEDLKETK